MRFTCIFMSLALFLCCLAPPARADGPLRERLRAHFTQQKQNEAQEGPGAQEGPEAQVVQMAGLAVAIWQPPAQAGDEGPFPLILFSHGFGGCKTQSRFLMQALARDGYIVAAPDHADAGCRRGGQEGSGGFHRPEQSFRDPKDWSAQTYNDRAADMKNLYDALKEDKDWSARIDWARVGLAGHSLGGYTVLGLAGGWPGWKMAGVKAVLALSPYCAPFAEKGTLSGIGVPVMYQGGTRDFGITPSVKKKGGCYDGTPAPAWFVEFDKTGHFGWTDIMSAAHGPIVDYSLWFFDRALKGADVPPPGRTGVADFRQKTEKLSPPRE
ncbi:MAG: alpha/beta fold hydrolase [Alphaproteobacteria bacterium]|nr:alpha/beta fold hydrolase [Alphaproteobacteria bacterium]